MPREDELSDAIWSRRTAVNTTPPAEVGTGVPIAQGSMWIVGDVVLELDQRERIRTAAMDCRAMDFANSITHQQQ